MSLVAIEIVER